MLYDLKVPSAEISPYTAHIMLPYIHTAEHFMSHTLNIVLANIHFVNQIKVCALLILILTLILITIWYVHK